MDQDRENENPEKVVDPNENQGNEKVTVDSPDKSMNVVDPNENQRSGSA